jgi:hypothetical protein
MCYLASVRSHRITHGVFGEYEQYLYTRVGYQHRLSSQGFCQFFISGFFCSFFCTVWFVVSTFWLQVSWRRSWRSFPRPFLMKLFNVLLVLAGPSALAQFTTSTRLPKISVSQAPSSLRIISTLHTRSVSSALYTSAKISIPETCSTSRSSPTSRRNSVSNINPRSPEISNLRAIPHLQQTQKELSNSTAGPGYQPIPLQGSSGICGGSPNGCWGNLSILTDSEATWPNTSRVVEARKLAQVPSNTFIADKSFAVQFHVDEYDVCSRRCH